MRTSLLSITLISLLLLPASVSARGTLHPQVEGVYENAEELEAACRALVDVGRGVERDNSLLFQVRRCVNAYHKKQKNTRRGIRRGERRQRVHMQLYKRSQEYKDRQNERQLRASERNLRLRTQQLNRKRRESRTIFSSIRSTERQGIRALEREEKSMTTAKRRAKSAARRYCRNYIATARAECIEQRMNELLEF